MKRLFAALKIDPGAEFLAKYRELQRKMHSEQIKWVEEHNIHITLKFFGETDERKIPAIATVLRSRAASVESVTLRLNGLGVFGSSYAPRVIWAGIEPYETVTDLMKNMHADLAAIGYVPDRQNLVPHLTLGRIRSISDRAPFKKTLDLFRSISSPVMHIGEIILFESILRREGPQYIAVDKFPLKKI